MDEHRSSWSRVLLGLFALGCGVGAIAMLPTRMEAVIIALFVLGLFFGWLALDGRVVEKFSLPGGVGAEFRKRTIREVFSGSATFTAEPPQVEAHGTAHDPAARASEPGATPQHLDRSATDNVPIGEDSAEATVGKLEEYERRAGMATKPEEYARLLLQALADRNRREHEEPPEG